MKKSTDVERHNWSEWKLFPDPEKKEYLYAPFWHGVYHLRNSKTNEYVLYGEGGNVAHRMSSILPKPYGQGTRKNENKRKYVLDNLKHIEYRTMACSSKEEALIIQREVKNAYKHIFDS